MSYIRIANKTKGVNRLYLEKLGLSTKRDNENTIGQFGSGSKFAPIAALRKGWEWINVGEDDIGPYKMQYVVTEESGIQCISYLYDDEILKSSSFTVDAGVLSWDSEFQIFREAFCNALDDFIEFDNEYSIDIVDEVKYEPGVFAVYLTAAPELVEIVEDFDKYFCIRRNPISTFEHYGAIYDNSGYDTRFFYKGILVHVDDNYKALFDYQLNNVTLNEERRVRNHFELHNRIASIWARLQSSNSDHVVIAEKLILNANVSAYEWNMQSHTIEINFFPNKDSAFIEAWKNIHGGKIAVPSNLMKFASQFALRNCEIVEIQSDALYSILSRVGVECADSILGDEIEYNFCSLNDDAEKLYQQAREIVTTYLPDFDAKVEEVKFFIPEGEQDRVFGVANLNTHMMYLSIKSFESLGTLVGTMIHEYDHISTYITDDDLAFRNLADEHIGKLLIDLYGGGSV